MVRVRTWVGGVGVGVGVSVFVDGLGTWNMGCYLNPVSIS